MKYILAIVNILLWAIIGFSTWHISPWITLVAVILGTIHNWAQAHIIEELHGDVDFMINKALEK